MPTVNDATARKLLRDNEPKSSGRSKGAGHAASGRVSAEELKIVTLYSLGMLIKALVFV